MRAVTYVMGFMCVAAMCTQAALAGVVAPPTAPDLDVSTLGYVATAVTGTYLAFKYGMFRRIFK